MYASLSFEYLLHLKRQSYRISCFSHWINSLFQPTVNGGATSTPTSPQTKSIGIFHFVDLYICSYVSSSISIVVTDSLIQAEPEKIQGLYYGVGSLLLVHVVRHISNPEKYFRMGCNCLGEDILGGPKRSFGFFRNILQKPERTFWPTQYIDNTHTHTHTHTEDRHLSDDKGQSLNC